jgi:hypothetical protein
MLPWEAKLFKAGAGCPSCEGVPNGYEPATMDDIENGDEDPIERIHARLDHESGNAPKWKRPEDPVLWECAGCGVQAIKDIDTGDLAYRVPYKSKARSWYSSHPFSCNEPDEEPAHVFDDETAVCEFCLSHCDHCGEAMCTYVEGLDGFYLQNHDVTLCGEDCLCAWEDEEAQELWRTGFTDAERLEAIRDGLYDVEYYDWKDLLAQVRGRYFRGCASELIG